MKAVRNVKTVHYKQRKHNVTACWLFSGPGRYATRIRTAVTCRKCRVLMRFMY